MSGVVPTQAGAGSATADNQTNGAQKSQIVDAGGEAATITGGKLDVNATVTPSGTQDVNITGDTIGLATGAKQDTGNTSLASIDGKITAVNTGAVVVSSSALPTGAATAARQDTGNTSLATIAGAVAGTEMQVDVLSMPSTTVTATDLDIRDLVFATDKVDASGTVLGAGTNNIGDVDVLTLPALPAGTNNIGDVDILSIAAGDNNIGNVDIVTMPNVVIGSGTVTAVTSITNTVNTKEVRSATPTQSSPAVADTNT